MWKLYQEKTYSRECRGSRPSQAIQNCLGKLGDLILNIFFFNPFLKNFFFTWKAHRSPPGWLTSLIWPTRGVAIGLGSMRKEFVKCETITVAIHSDKSVLMDDNSSRWLCFAFQFLLVVYPFTASVLTRCTFLPHRAVLACLLHATLKFLLNKLSQEDYETHFNRDFSPCEKPV